MRWSNRYHTTANLLDNERMVSQLVVQPWGESPNVHIDVAVGAEWRNGAGAQTLHLGSQDLIRVAGFAQENGFSVVRFFLADSYLFPLDSEDEDVISSELVSILTDFGAREIQSAMHDEHAGLFVIGIELISISSGLRIVLRRRGYVDTSVIDEAKHLLDLAWRELKLT